PSTGGGWAAQGTVHPAASAKPEAISGRPALTRLTLDACGPAPSERACAFGGQYGKRGISLMWRGSHSQVLSGVRRSVNAALTASNWPNTICVVRRAAPIG